MRKLNKDYPKHFTDVPIMPGVAIRPMPVFADGRGWLAELYRTDELHDVTEHLMPLMGYISETMPGVQRGPHEHADQTDVFVFVRGQCRLYLWDNRPESATYGGRTQYFFDDYSSVWQAVVPPGVVHAYKNDGPTPMLVFNGPDLLYKGLYKKDTVDEVRHELDPDTPFVVW